MKLQDAPPQEDTCATSGTHQLMEVNAVLAMLRKGLVGPKTRRGLNKGLYPRVAPDLTDHMLFKLVRRTYCSVALQEASVSEE